VEAASLIQGRIDTILLEHSACSVMLTGGRSAAQLYMAWSDLPAFQQITGVRFYFGDERGVPRDNPESNYGMAMRTLFHQGVPAGCAVFRMEADDPDRETAAHRYGETLPDRVDVMLLGVGEDGHIASLFPGSGALHETTRPVVPVIVPKPPRERMTITPTVIARARSVFVLAAGAAKAAVLARALKAPNDVTTLPACLVLNATWLLDAAATESHF
jgi:6-phosphogluconolactonase